MRISLTISFAFLSIFFPKNIESEQQSFPPQMFDMPTKDLEIYKIFKEKVLASYYAHYFHGRTTANGEKFDMHALTAAHKTLRFGTIVRVTDLETDSSVIVRINDRGPYQSKLWPYEKQREIDLSYGAFKKISSLTKGLSRVKLEIVKKN